MIICQPLYHRVQEKRRNTNHNNRSYRWIGIINLRWRRVLQINGFIWPDWYHHHLNYVNLDSLDDLIIDHYLLQLTIIL